MRRGLDIDVLECPACGGRLRFVAAIMLSSAIRRILRHLGLRSDPVELEPKQTITIAGAASTAGWGLGLGSGDLL